MKTLGLFALSILSYFSNAQTKFLSEEQYLFEKNFKNKSLIASFGRSNRNLELIKTKDKKTSLSMYNSGIGVCIDLTGLANFDNYPTSGAGFELGLTQIYSRGISLNANIGGSSNDWIWLGGSVGYTHGFYKWAPYGRIGFAATFEAFEAGLAGYLEFGSYFRLTNWLSVKPGARFVLIKTESPWQSNNFNLLMVSFSIDPFQLIPYTSY